MISAGTGLPNVNAPVDVDGGAGLDKVTAVGTEMADNLVLTAGGIFGAGLNVHTTASTELRETDALEGNDNLFVLSTAAGTATTAIGGLGTDNFSITGDVTAAVTSRDLEGRSAVLQLAVAANQLQDPVYNGLLASGVGVHIADVQRGQVVIKESDGDTRVAETPGGTVDSYQVFLAVAPNAPVYVTVSAALSASEEAAAGGKTILVSTDGVNYVRGLVLTFTAANWNLPQTVFVKADDDLLAEGERGVNISHSVASTDAKFNQVPVRDVAVTVADDDTPGLLLTQTGGSTLVLEGSLLTGITDSYTVALTKAPAAGKTVTVTLTHDAQVALASADQRYNPVLGTITFSAANWNVPVTMQVSAVNDAVPENRMISAIRHTASSTDAAFVLPAPAVLEVTVVDDDTPGVLVTETDGSTLVVKNGPGDSYSVRLTKAPVGTVTIQLLGDGQTLLSSIDARFNAQTKTITFGPADWYVPVTINVAADPNFVPVQQDAKPFPIEPHTTSKLRGPLTLVGGLLAGADRSLVTAIVLQPEKNAALPPNPAPPVNEALQTDSVTVYNDTSVSNDAGTLSTTNLSGLGTSGLVVFNVGAQLIPVPGGINYSAIENLDVLLGTGNDTFTVASTLAADASAGGRTKIYGGGGSDTLIVTGGGGAASKLVLYGDGPEDNSRYDAPVGVPSASGVAFDFSGNNLIDASGSTLGVIAYGGAGNDTLRGGSGNDVLVGGAGSDNLQGGAGSDILIGGIGQDVLDGGIGQDILVGGSYKDSAKLDALDALMALWSQAGSYQQRMLAVRFGVPYALNAQTVIDDGVADQLTGGLDLDWFWAFGADGTDRDIINEQLD